MTRMTKKLARYKKPVSFWVLSGRARTIAIRWRSDRGVLPRQLRSIDGRAKKFLYYVYSQQKHNSSPSTRIYSYTITSPSTLR